MPTALLTLAALHGLLGYGISATLDLPTLLRIGIPILLLAANILLAPYIMERAYRIDWSPESPPLDEEVCKFLLELFQMHGKAPPNELSMVLGARAALPIPIGQVEDDAPAIMLLRSPIGGLPGLVVTTGFTKALDTEAQKAAVAHEAYYLVGGESTAGLTALMALPSVLLTAYRVIEADPRRGLLGQKAATVLFALYRMSAAVTAWNHRGRIYRADAFAAEMTGNPNAMADAVMVLSFGMARTMARPAASSSAAWSPLNLADASRAAELGAEAEAMGDFSPEGMARALHWERHNLAARFFEIFSFHPLPSRRLRELEQKASTLGHDFRYPLDSDQGYRVVALVAEFLSRTGPWGGALIGGLLCHEYDWPSNLPLYLVGGFLCGVIVAGALWYPPLSRYQETTSRDLLQDIDASESWPMPVELRGVIAGRERPGYAFGPELVLEDSRGQMTIQYKQPLPFVDSVFAYAVVDELRGRPVRVQGWFRRNPSPFVEIRRMVMLDDGTTYGCYRWLLQWAMVLVLSGFFYWLWGVL